jgi:hypothetical protein
LTPFTLFGAGDGNQTRDRLIKDKIVNYGKNISLNRVDADIFKTLASGELVGARFLPYREPFMMTDYTQAPISPLILNLELLPDNSVSAIWLKVNIVHRHSEIV